MTELVIDQGIIMGTLSTALDFMSWPPGLKLFRVKSDTNPPALRNGYWKLIKSAIETNRASGGRVPEKIIAEFQMSDGEVLRHLRNDPHVINHGPEFMGARMRETSEWKMVRQMTGWLSGVNGA